ncbi:MAG: NlpC/P60 family protein, partial [Nitrospirales bacterium]
HATTTRVRLSNIDAVKRLLYAQLKEWKAVRYDYGGLSKNGVDCSGFVYLTFLENFGVALPRTAVEQSNLGSPITQRQLLPGDLVFFKTGRVTRHVGIFVEDRQFLHASKSRGVMLSNLDDVYWSKKYWKAKRINAYKPLALDRRQNSSQLFINVEVPRVCWSA